MTAQTTKLRKVHIEISNVCNLQCTFCPEVEREKKQMSEELFTKLVQEAKPLTEEICFHVMGEPLAHPLFDKFVTICETEKAPVNIVTNGTLLNEERIEALLNPTVRQVNFSLQSFSSNFPGVDPSTYLEKIFEFTKRAFAERPDLYINYRLWNLSDPQTNNEENEMIFQKIEAAFEISVNRNVDVRRIKSKRLLNRLYLHFDSRFIWPHPQAPLQGTKGFCHALSGHVAIHADGTLVPCCLDKEAAIALGSCKTSSLKDLLASPRAENMRKGFAAGELKENLCQRCTYIQRFSSKQN